MEHPVQIVCSSDEDHTERSKSKQAYHIVENSVSSAHENHGDEELLETNSLLENHHAMHQLHLQEHSYASQDESAYVYTEMEPEVVIECNEETLFEDDELNEAQEIIYVCERCTKEFKSEDDFNEHSILEHAEDDYDDDDEEDEEEEDKTWICGQCWKEFHTEDAVLKHVSIHKDEGADEVVSRSNMSLTEQRSKQNGEGFKNNLDRHLNCEHGTNNKCGKCEGKLKLLNVCVATLQTFLSEHCDDALVEESQLQKHVEHMHTQDSGCEKSKVPLKRKAEQDTSEKEQESTKQTRKVQAEDILKERNISTRSQSRIAESKKCKTLREKAKSADQRTKDNDKSCGKSFKVKDRLRKHVVVRHKKNKIKMHKCKDCGKTFDRPCDLQRHSVAHTDERPYPCSQCGKRFKTPTALSDHSVAHTDVRPYMCVKCGKRFKTNQTLIWHQFQHTNLRPHQCEKCGKSFKVKTTLLRHLAGHSEERPFVCNICGKGFKKADILTGHMVVHSDEKPFPCERCGRGFKWKRDLKRHYLSHRDTK